jgi:hypothetical protein
VAGPVTEGAAVSGEQVSREAVYWAARYFGLDPEEFLRIATDPTEVAATAAYYGDHADTAARRAAADELRSVRGSR